MEIQNQLRLDVLDEVQTNEATYLLRELEVYNWGPFAGLHRAEIDPVGTAIIGPTGSGKTTLIDGLMTLLVSQPRYNLASTGGHESDRTLIQYVRGVLGGDGSDGCEEVARPGKTLSGLCATYAGGGETLKLAGLFWTEGSSNAAQDLKRRWLFSLADDQSLENWLRLLYEEGVRDLMRLGRETAKLRIFDSKKAYLAHARKFFDVGENAFTLLNRAAGLKQLNSIDEIFRELVLEERTAFDRALEVAAEFDNLAAIHTELETARRQQQSLVPVEEEHRKLLKSRDREKRFRILKCIVPVWYAMAGEKLWTEVLDQIVQDRDEKESLLKREEQEEKSCSKRVGTLRERYLELGGNVIGELENTIKAQKDRVKERHRYADDYRRIVGAFGLSEELSEVALRRSQTALGKKRKDLEDLYKAAEDETIEARSQLRDQESKAREVKMALQKVEDRPGSNIPPRFQDFRAELAATLGLVDDDLPFVAELVEVKPEEAAWRGAIERAIGSERLRILVPDQQIEDALRWVNDRDNRLHVRLQQAQLDIKPVSFFPDGFLRKLNFKNHPLQRAAESLLASRDRHCVASPEALRQTEHGLTIEGTMSGRHGRYEKQDQRKLHDNWMTGFDNKDQLNALAGQLGGLHVAIKACQKTAKKCQTRLKHLNDQLTMVDRILKLEYATIDLPGAESDLQASQERLAALLDPDSDTSRAKSAFDAEEEKLKAILKRISVLQQEITEFNVNWTQADRQRDKAAKRIGQGLNEEEALLAGKRLRIPSDVEAEDIDSEERKAVEKVDAKLNKQIDRVAEIVRHLVGRMFAAKNIDTGALADTGSELDDIPDYLERLRVLNEEALPEKLSRFREYLNRSSDQGVTQLISGIEEEVDGIEHRIAELNQTLIKVNFRSNRYLQLQPQRIKHERIRSLESAMRKLRNAALKDDEGESHYAALRDLVDILRDAGENRRQLGSRALLDPRYRLQFFVVEVDRQTGDRSPPRTGSQSGSGGEKELMASHILTASLSYALCPTEATRPLYGTVVLDEAFSKSSPSAASRIIEALRVFNLHPIFVTPNKEIGLLKKHTRKIICVQRPGKEASLASISWEALENWETQKGRVLPR